MILLMGEADDPQVMRIADVLTEMQKDFTVFDSTFFPASHKLSYRPADNSMQLQVGEHCLAHNDIRSLYWRTLSPPQSANPIAVRDSASLLRSFLYSLGDRAKNSAEAVRFHQEKPRQLALVAQLGIQIPETYVGNDPNAIKAFCKRHSKVIFKPVTGGDYAQIVSEAHLANEHLQTSMNQSPLTLQAYVEGTNIRSYVLGDCIFSAEIRSAAQDFRTDEDAELIPVTLPDDIALQAKAICRTLGLAWSGIDWRRTPTNDYVFLEANPSPMFTNFEKRTQLPIAKHLAQLLAA
jgi:glutathione synthase/RimK-type ligase-like ATP-grasp enzyme